MEPADTRDETTSLASAWPARAAGLALAGTVIGIAYSLLLPQSYGRGLANETARLFVATFLVVGGIALAFTIERVRASWSTAFALGAGLLVALVSLWNGPWSDWNSDEPWRFLCALLTVAIAAPFFQASSDRGRWSADYADLHGHAWTNVVVWFASLAFTGVAFLLAHLLAALFTLIGIGLLRDLLREDRAGWAIAGGAFGAGVGLLRDNGRIVRLLQRVVVTVLSVLAPVLAAGLVLFLVALPFTGLAPLWNSTRSTTPILLSCVIGALILANGVIGNGIDEEARSPILRWSGAALAVSVLPLALIAAVSTGSRVAQHGMSPDRLWAIVFVAVFVAYGAAYLLAVLRRRTRWADAVRPANVQLALGLLVVAAFLATPVANFGAVSARDQLARLASGKTKTQDFDFQALRFDFGPAGLRALDRLARQGASDDIRRLARDARKQTSRVYGPRRPSETSLAAQARTVRILPAPAPLPPALRDAIFTGAGGLVACDGKNACVLFWSPADRTAVVVGNICHDGRDCRVMSARLRQKDGTWTGDYGFDNGPPLSSAQRRAVQAAEADALTRGEVEIRNVVRRQVFVGGKPNGNVFD